MFRHRFLIPTAALALGALPSCDAEMTPQARPRTGISNGGTGHHGWGCKTCGFANSPMLGPHALGSVRARHEPLSGDVGLIGLRDLDGNVHDGGAGELGIFASKDDIVVTGADLVGWTLLFGDGFDELEAEIFGYDSYPDWAHGKLVDTYAIGYWPSGPGEGSPTNICPGLDLDQTSAVVIADELYDETTGNVRAQPGWITFACRGHAITKMKFLGYDPNDAYRSTRLEREATLRMLRADYCGDGSSFTQVGQPLDWVDAAGHVELPHDHEYKHSDVEARWTSRGAQCVNVPRHVDRRVALDDCPSVPFCGEKALTPGDVTWVSINL